MKRSLAQELSHHLIAVCGDFEVDTVSKAVVDVTDSVYRDVKTLRFSHIVAQMASQMPPGEAIVRDDGSGAKYADLVTLAMDNYLELAALAYFLHDIEAADVDLSTKSDDKDSECACDDGDDLHERREDVRCALRKLPDLWFSFYRLAFTELRDPIDAGGPEGKSDDDLKVESDVVDVDVCVDVAAAEKKKRDRVARVDAANKRNTALAAAVAVSLQSLLFATRDVLSIGQRLGVRALEVLTAEQARALSVALALAGAVVMPSKKGERNSVGVVTAAQAEYEAPAEALRRLRIASSASVSSGGGGGVYCYHRDDECNVTAAAAATTTLCFECDPSCHLVGTALRLLAAELPFPSEGRQERAGEEVRVSSDEETNSKLSSSPAREALECLRTRHPLVLLPPAANAGSAHTAAEAAAAVLCSGLAAWEQRLTAATTATRPEAATATQHHQTVYQEAGFGILPGAVRAVYAVFACAYLPLLPLHTTSTTGTYYAPTSPNPNPNPAPRATTAAMMATAAPLALRLLGEASDHLKCIGAVLLQGLLVKADSGLIIAVSSWLLPEMYHHWEMCSEITRDTAGGRTQDMRRGLISGEDSGGKHKRGNTNEDEEHKVLQQEDREQRRLSYMSSLLLGRALHCCFCVTSSSGSSTTTRHQYKYIDALLHKVRLYVSAPASVWSLLSQASAFVRHHHGYHSRVIGNDDGDDDAHTRAIRERLRYWQQYQHTRSATGGAGVVLDSSSLVLVSMARPIVTTLTSVMHDCCHAAVHFHCLQWIGLVLMSLQLQPQPATQQQQQQQHRGGGNDNLVPGMAEMQVHLLLVPELLRLLVFYYSGIQDLWATLPSSWEKGGGGGDAHYPVGGGTGGYNYPPNGDAAGLAKRAGVVCEAEALLAYILHRHSHSHSHSHSHRLPSSGGCESVMQLVKVLASGVDVTTPARAAAAAAVAGDSSSSSTSSSSTTTTTTTTTTLFALLPMVLWGQD
jgi:hypothetical protein